MDKTPKKRYNFRKRKGRKVNYKIHEESDSSDSDYEPNESDSDDSILEDETIETDKKDPISIQEVRSIIAQLYPSKYTNDRMEKIQEVEEEIEQVESNDKKKRKKKKRKKVVKKDKKENKKVSLDVEEQEEDEEEDLTSQLMDSQEEDDDMIEMMKKNNMKFNIIFTVGGEPENEYNEFDVDTEGEEDETVKERNKNHKYKKGEIVEVKFTDWEDWYEGTIVKINDNDTYKIKFDDAESRRYGSSYDKVKRKYMRPRDNYDEALFELEKLTNIKKKKGKKAMVHKFKQMAEALEKKRETEQKEVEQDLKLENEKDFSKLLKDKNVMNDFRYFKNLTREKQEKILDQLKAIREYSQTDKPYRLSIIEADIPIEYKSTALRKLSSLSRMDTGTGEYYKMKLWVDTFMKIPFGKIETLPITIDSGTELCHAFMENAKKILDEAAYGLEDAKMQIMQVLGQLITNPNAMGTAIAIKGPPGTGKTTLIKEGVSKILKRPFAFLALGGATDSSFLEGHSHTYEGSTWGEIVSILIKAKCMNPIIYMDELDKISDTPKGDEITGILTHLTDTTQNDKFHDKYFSNIDFNLNKVVFIFSYNDEKRINPILKDRMYRIETKGYDTKQKVVIARDYLIPKIERNVNFDKGQIIIPQDTIEHLIGNSTENEKGVRNLKRCLEIIYTKLNLYRLMKPDSTLFNKEKALKVEFPFTVKKDIIDKLIKPGTSDIPFGLYC